MSDCSRIMYTFFLNFVHYRNYMAYFKDRIRIRNDQVKRIRIQFWKISFLFHNTAKMVPV